MQFFKRNRIGLARDMDAAETARPSRRNRVLVVDEDPVARGVIARRLSHRHYDVAVAENGFVALNLLIGTPMDVILIDMGMTMLPGIATMKKIKAAGLAGQACFVMITSHANRQDAVEALEAGADDHLAKPFDFDILDARLRHLCARAEKVGALARQNAELDARIARRAVELGEARDALRELQHDRARLVASIQSLHDEIERLNAQG